MRTLFISAKLSFFLLFLCASTPGQSMSFAGDELIEVPDYFRLARDSELHRDSFFDPKHDYSRFEGRVTDRDQTGRIFKVYSVEKNIRFLRAGDPVKFQVSQRRGDQLCQARVRDTVEDYLIIYVHNLTSCWNPQEDLRRGSVLEFHAPRLQERVQEASRFRYGLLQRREDFFEQLNGVNHFLWSYDQQRVIVAAEYDKKIQELQRKKQEALNTLNVKKNDQILLQRKLMGRLDEIDRDLEFYRIDHHSSSRWQLDRDTGLPLQKRPQEMIR